jgi:hypothetical protein
VTPDGQTLVGIMQSAPQQQRNDVAYRDRQLTHARHARDGLRGATDVGPASAGCDAAKSGYLINGGSIEHAVGDTATATLTAAGVKSVSKAPFLDVTACFSYDKIEGVAQLNGGRTVFLPNNGGFGIDGLTQDAITPFTEFLAVDMTKLPAATSTATVTFTVR